jgi:hypothetical protein
MTLPLYSLKVRSRRDILLARQRTRQLSRLLGFEEPEQLLLAAAVFEFAWSAFQSRGRVVLNFELFEDRLRIACSRPRSARLEEEERRQERRPSRLHDKGRRAVLPMPVAELALRLEKPLPTKPGPVPVEDVAWSMRELAQQTPLNLFEEVRQCNLELLRLASNERRSAKDTRSAA